MSTAPVINLGDAIICRRVNGEVQVNVPHRIVRHSPDGFEWGYAGSGPAELALNILACVVGQKRAEKGGLYQRFKSEFIAPMPDAGGEIKVDTILAWVAENEYE